MAGVEFWGLWMNAQSPLLSSDYNDYNVVNFTAYKAQQKRMNSIILFAITDNVFYITPG
jgi:hypothetical protein